MGNPLWAPWRMEYILAPKDRSRPCVFCGVASASPGEAPLLAGEARRGEDRSYVYTCGLLHWFANVTTFCRESAGRRDRSALSWRRGVRGRWSIAP